MDRRTSKRRSLRMKISLQRPNLTISYHRTNNVSRDGMNIEMAHDDFHVNEKLLLAFDLAQYGIDKSISLPVSVTRVDQKHIGLSFLKSRSFKFEYAHQMLARKCFDQS